MPHIRVEYSQSLEPMMSQLLSRLHKSLAENGIDINRIKTRGIPVGHAYVGENGTQGKMIHATLLLLAGRDTETKKKYGDDLYALIKDAMPNNCVATLEIRDMNPETYYL